VVNRRKEEIGKRVEVAKPGVYLHDLVRTEPRNVQVLGGERRDFGNNGESTKAMSNSP